MGGAFGGANITLLTKLCTPNPAVSNYPLHDSTTAGWGFAVVVVTNKVVSSPITNCTAKNWGLSMTDLLEGSGTFVVTCARAKRTVKK